MNNLIIESSKYKKEFDLIADAVYRSLNQTAPLKVELIFMTEAEMRELNFKARGVDKVTDVLSFPTLDGVRDSVILTKNHPLEMDGDRLFIGSIVLCEEKIKEQAKEFMHSQKRERTYLTVHGLMHLFGYDHIDEQGKKQMREREKTALRLLGLDNE